MANGRIVKRATKKGPTKKEIYYVCTIQLTQRRRQTHTSKNRKKQKSYLSGLSV